MNNPNDLISRAAAIEAFIGKPPEYYHTSYIVDELNCVPAVDAVPVVHGRPVWINPLAPEAKMCAWKCSSLCSICRDYVAESWKYCPNCGAKMDEETR